MQANKQLPPQTQSSPFKDLAGIEYFLFEEDFIQENVRCIPMIVRFKLDAVGIKLKLKEWSRIDVPDRMQLASMNCSTAGEKKEYFDYLSSLINKYTGGEPTIMQVDENPGWADVERLTEPLIQRSLELNLIIRMEQWRSLSNLQRFALLKLARPGHESRNFPKAVKEFGLHNNKF